MMPHAAMAQREELYLAWREAFGDWRIAVRGSSPDLRRINDRAHNTLKAYLRAVEGAAGAISASLRHLGAREEGICAGRLLDALVDPGAPVLFNGAARLA
jgi:hypothetical protein